MYTIPNNTYTISEAEIMAAINKQQISHIKIKGYRSIGAPIDLTLDRINVLIGSNGSGKSNFISALTLLQNVVSQNLAFFSNMSGVNSMFYKGTKITDEIEVEVFFGMNSYGFILTPTDDGRVIFKNEYFGYHGQFENRSVISRGHGEAMWMQGVNNKLSNYIVPILQTQGWRVYHFHDTSANAKVKQAHNIGNNVALQFDASNLAAFLYRLKHTHPNNYLDIVSTIRIVADYFDDFVLVPNEFNPELISLRWKQRGCDDVMSASQFSDGTLRFICLATLLLQPEELKPQTIIIDEPELGLHPYAINVLSEMIHSCAEQKQIIISTQSVELLNEFAPEDIIVVDRGENGSVFRRLDTEALDEWLDDYSLGELWQKNLLGGRLTPVRNGQI